MKALIVEDEKPAQETLIRAIARNFPDIEVVAVTESVKATLAWLRIPGNHPDLIFLDVELQDGSSFEIFRQETISAKVIMTTAYDKYAIKAFEAGSIDYLLKPIGDEQLQRAVSRCRTVSENHGIRNLLTAMQDFTRDRETGSTTFRKRFMIHLGKKIIPVQVDDIAYFYVEGKSRYIVKKDGMQYYFDQQIESVLEELDPQVFFRVSRNYVVSAQVIQGIERVYGSRLKILLPPPLKAEIIVARSRVHDFMEWIG